MIEIREAKLDDVGEIVKLYHEIWGDKYPYSDYINESEIERLIKEEECIWMLALEDNAIIGSGACVHNKWNNSTEFGRGVIKKEHRTKHHIANLASKKLVDLAFERGFDVCWGTPRNRQVYYVVTNLGFSTVGYMPGPYIVDFREIYLFAEKLSESGKKKRITPVNKNEIYNLPLVKLINGVFGLKDNPGGYPADSFVGDDAHQTGLIKLKYVCAHNTLFILSSHNPAPKDIHYIEGDILIDKTETINLLKSAGFKITAYLPAWYGTDKRYDCVKMVRAFKEYNSYDEFICNLKNKIEEALKDG